MRQQAFIDLLKRKGWIAVAKRKIIGQPAGLHCLLSRSLRLRDTAYPFMAFLDAEHGRDLIS